MPHKEIKHRLVDLAIGSVDSPEMATELADLVMVGTKRATASLARDYGEGREPMPKPGDFVMMLVHRGKNRRERPLEPPRVHD